MDRDLERRERGLLWRRARLQATNGPKYLSINAGGPAGMTFVHVCVWPAHPKDDHCGD